MEKKDCEVCTKLIRQKYKHILWWKIGCIVFCALSVTLGVLYFNSGTITTEINIEVSENTIQNDGDNGTIAIANEKSNNAYSGTIEKQDYMPLICLTIIISMSILIGCAVIIVDYFKEK